MHTYVANALFHKGNWDVILGNGQQISVFLRATGWWRVPHSSTGAEQNALGSFRFVTTTEVLESYFEVLNLPSYPKELTMHLK